MMIVLLKKTLAPIIIYQSIPATIDWKNKFKASSFTRFTFSKDKTIMVFHNPAYDGKAHTCSFKLIAAMQPGKDMKDALGITLLKTDSVSLISTT
jgi:hypothetical protein